MFRVHAEGNVEKADADAAVISQDLKQHVHVRHHSHVRFSATPVAVTD